MDDVTMSGMRLKFFVWGTPLACILIAGPLALDRLMTGQHHDELFPITMAALWSGMAGSAAMGHIRDLKHKIAELEKSK